MARYADYLTYISIVFQYAGYVRLRKVEHANRQPALSAADPMLPLQFAYWSLAPMKPTRHFNSLFLNVCVPFGIPIKFTCTARHYSRNDSRTAKWIFMTKMWNSLTHSSIGWNRTYLTETLLQDQHPFLTAYWLQFPRNSLTYVSEVRTFRAIQSN
jgi:hypothetical protein